MLSFRMRGRVLAGSLVFLLAALFASASVAEEKILNYHSDIKIDRDGSLIVLFAVQR